MVSFFEACNCFLLTLLGLICMQVFPQVLEIAIRAAGIVSQTCKSGAIDIDAIALSLTAGM